MDNMLITKIEARTIMVALQQNLDDWGPEMDTFEVAENARVLKLIQDRWPDLA